MLALSVRQPWAWLIVQGFKDIENRPWPAWQSVLGQRVYIHASKRFDRNGYRVIRQRFPDVCLPCPETFDRGGIVGSVIVTGCVTDSPSRWFTGPYGFTLAEAMPCTYRRCTGTLGFFKPRFC